MIYTPFTYTFSLPAGGHHPPIETAGRGNKGPTKSEIHAGRRRAPYRLQCAIIKHNTPDETTADRARARERVRNVNIYGYAYPCACALRLSTSRML